MNILTKSSKWILAVFALLLTFPVLAQTDTQNTQTDENNPLWMRYSAISPNGQNIAFATKAIFIKLMQTEDVLLCLLCTMPMT